jgi:TRAP-type C4-dicarboxylate transport system substrate-binding protein
VHQRLRRAAAQPAAAFLLTIVTLVILGLASAAQAQQRLRVVGGLAGVAQYEQLEKPFWTQRLPQASGGSVTADIVPFDQAGIHAQEMLRLMQLGVVQFGNVLLSAAATQDPILAAPDLAGLVTDGRDLETLLKAFRPTLARVLNERYGVRLLAIYAYPAQVLFCKAPLGSLTELAGRRVRTSGVAQADLVEAFGGKPVQTAFAEVPAALRQGTVDCAITGTLSGYSLGLHQLTRALNTQPFNWGLAAFAVNASAWEALPAGTRALLEQELAQLEHDIVQSAVRQTAEGIACNTGAGQCLHGRPGAMVATANAADAARMQRVFREVVLPRWLKRCGSACGPVWEQTIAPALGQAAAR